MNLPYIAKIGEIIIPNDYVTECEVKIPDLDSEFTKRSAKGVLTRDRLAQIPTVTIVLKRGIFQGDVLLKSILAEIRKPVFKLEWFDTYQDSFLVGDFYGVQPTFKMLSSVDFSGSDNGLYYDQIRLECIGFRGV